MIQLSATLLVSAAFSAALSAAQRSPDESDYYAVDYLTPPDGELLEVGGMDFLDDGRLVVSTRRGQVWLVENALAEDPEEAVFKLFAEGLQEGLGLKVVNGEIYVVQRAELSRLRDTDDDDECDVIDTISNGWGVSGNYHEFAFGLPVDDAGNMYVSLNVAFFSPMWWHGKSTVPWRGWVLKIAPDGTMEPFASGLRSPCGIGFNAAGDLFVTDNQGDWMPVCPLFHIQEDRFYGHPASLDWTEEYQSSQTLSSDTIPPNSPRANAAAWIPYDWSRSTGNMVPDSTGGKFGPFEDQLMLAEVTNGHVLRADLEKVRGEYQGAVFLMRQKVGSACRVRFAPDGTLFCGFTNRGWGGLAPASGIARVRWTGKTPLEMERVHLLQDGFEITFTLPLAGEVAPSQVNLVDYDYDWWWEYGSPERAREAVEIAGAELSEDRRTLTVRTVGLEPAKVARMRLTGVTAQDGSPLLHEEFAYTINQLPEGPLTDRHIAKLVPPPPARESGEEGWLRMTYGDALDQWESSGWILCDAELDAANPEKLATKKGVNALVNVGPDPSEFISKPVFGDIELHLEFMLPEKGNSGVYLMGNYEVQLCDNRGRTELRFGDLGGIYRGESWMGAAPGVDHFKGPGEWHDLDLVFQAPRFDADGNKVSNAAFLSVSIDDQLVHEKVEVPEPTLGNLGPEVPFGPLRLQGDHSHVAYGNIRIKPYNLPADDEGWTPLLTEADEDDELARWKQTGNAEWVLEDGVLTGTGAVGHIFSPRGDYVDFDLRARVKIGESSNSGLYFRTAYGEGWPAGYEAQINSSYPDPQKTGSLYNLAPVKVQLVAPDTWFDYFVSCRDEPAGTRVTIRVNGVVVTDFVDAERRHGAGHVALQQHHDGSVVEIADLQIRERPRESR